MKTSTPLILATALAMGIGTAFAQSAPGGGPPKSSAPMAREPGGATMTNPPATGPVAPNPPAIANNPPIPAPGRGMPADGVISTQAEAYNRLEQQGYRDINGLALGTDGNWHATALRGAVQVRVMVSPQGAISAN